MKTFIKVILGLILAGILAFAGYIAYRIVSLNAHDLGRSTKYLTKEELTDSYWQNKELLNSVKDSVISSKSLLRALDRFNEGDIEIRYQSDKEYFSEKDWENIVTVFENLHPSMLMLERKGRQLVFYLTFKRLNQGLGSKYTFLYWFPNEEEREYHEEPDIFPDGIFTQLEEGWYIVEETYTR